MTSDVWMIMHIELLLLHRRLLHSAQRFLDQVTTGALQIGTQAQTEHGVNEPFRGVPVAEAVFGDGIVPGKGVVIVVESFTHTGDGDPPVFSWLDLVIVRSVSEYVSG